MFRLTAPTFARLLNLLDVKNWNAWNKIGVDLFHMSATQVDNLAGMTGQANKQLTEKMKKLESENKTLKKGL